MKILVVSTKDIETTVDDVDNIVRSYADESLSLYNKKGEILAEFNTWIYWKQQNL